MQEVAITSNSRVPNRTTYREAGVDIDAGNELVRAIKPLAKSTMRKGADAELGGFGALFRLKDLGYKDPVLVSTTDGVGTKLKIAIETGRHDTIGIDLVAMCVNDLIVQGAEPLFFLDYYATGKLDTGTAKSVIAGIAEGCRQAECALVGGETAEMPGMYHDKDYDLAGFSVGVVEADAILPRKDIKEGDCVLGLASSGLHSNGYSLVRKIVADQGLSYEAKAPFEPLKTLAECLLEPTRIYVRSLRPVIKQSRVKALAHITGGGLLENIPRILPDDLGVSLAADAWDMPPLFKWLAKVGNVDAIEMSRTFNCGLGMIVIVNKEDERSVSESLKKEGEKVFSIGNVEQRQTDRSVNFRNFSAVFPC